MRVTQGINFPVPTAMAARGYRCLKSRKLGASKELWLACPGGDPHRVVQGLGLERLENVGHSLSGQGSRIRPDPGGRHSIAVRDAKRWHSLRDIEADRKGIKKPTENDECVRLG